MNRDRDRVQRALREPGPREAGYSPIGLPATAEDARARLSGRSRWLASFGPLGGLAAAVAAGAVIAILVGRGITPAPGSGGPAASPSATPSPAAVAACRAGDLAWSSDPWGGAPGSRGTIVVARGVATLQGCEIRGTATLTLRDANDALLVTGHTALNDVRLTAGMQFEVGVTWSNWCAVEPAQPISLQLTLPGDATPVPLIPANDHGLTFQTCNGPGQPSTLGGTNFQPSSRPPIQG
jgi:hypothetical protein